MIFVFVRHGIAMDRAESISKGIEEGDRPLIKEGRDKSKKMAELLREMDLGAMEMISSPFMRAVETAEIFKKTLGLDAKISLTEDLLPERSFVDFADYLKKRSSHSEVLLIFGHEPNLSHLISTVLGSKKSFVEMKKSGFAVIEAENLMDLSAGNAKLLYLLGPRILKTQKQN